MTKKETIRRNIKFIGIICLIIGMIRIIMNGISALLFFSPFAKVLGERIGKNLSQLKWLSVIGVVGGIIYAILATRLIFFKNTARMLLVVFSFISLFWFIMLIWLSNFLVAPIFPREAVIILFFLVFFYMFIVWYLSRKDVKIEFAE